MALFPLLFYFFYGFFGQALGSVTGGAAGCAGKKEFVGVRVGRGLSPGDPPAPLALSTWPLHPGWHGWEPGVPGAPCHRLLRALQVAAAACAAAPAPIKSPPNSLNYQLFWVFFCGFFFPTPPRGVWINTISLQGLGATRGAA